MKLKLIIPMFRAWLAHRVFGDVEQPATFLIFLKSGQTMTLKGVTKYSLERGPNGFVSYTFERAPWTLAYEFVIDPQNIAAIQQIK